MSNHDKFLAMILANAKREEAKGVALTVFRSISRIDLLLLDGSSRPLQAPPPEVLIAIIERLESGHRSYHSQIYAVRVDAVDIQRGIDSVIAHISEWKMESADDDD